MASSDGSLTWFMASLLAMVWLSWHVSVLKEREEEEVGGCLGLFTCILNCKRWLCVKWDPYDGMVCVVCLLAYSLVSILALYPTLHACNRRHYVNRGLDRLFCPGIYGSISTVTYGHHGYSGIPFHCSQRVIMHDFQPTPQLQRPSVFQA